MSGIARISTVTDAASSYDLTDLTTVKSELNKTDTADDALLSKYITWASAAISSECARVFGVETIQDRFLADLSMRGIGMGNSSESLMLSRWPVQDIGTVTVTENGVALVADTDFALDGNKGKILRLATDGNVRRWCLWPVVVIYDGGYDDPAVPGDVTDAAVRMVKNRFNLRGRDPYLRSENIPGVRDASWWIATGNEAGNMPPDIVDLLASYRVPVIG